MRLANRKQITLEDSIYFCNVADKLYSVNRLKEAGINTECRNNGEKIIKKNKIVVVKNLGIYNTPIFEFGRNNLFRLCHERLGHIRKRKFLEIKRKNLFSDEFV